MSPRPRRAAEVDVAVQHVDAGEVVRDGEEVLDRPDLRGALGALLHFGPGSAVAVLREFFDLMHGERAARHRAVAAAERTRPRAVGGDAAVPDGAVRRVPGVSDEGADRVARAPDGAGAPAVGNHRGGVGESSGEAAVVVAGGAHVAARHAVGDHERSGDVADEAADVALAVDMAVGAAIREAGVPFVGTDEAAGERIGHGHVTRCGAAEEGRAVGAVTDVTDEAARLPVTC